MKNPFFSAYIIVCCVSENKWCMDTKRKHRKGKTPFKVTGINVDTFFQIPQKTQRSVDRPEKLKKSMFTNFVFCFNMYVRMGHQLNSSASAKRYQQKSFFLKC